MREEKTSFYSDGFKLDAGFFFPEGVTEADLASKPIVIVCSGFQGLKALHPERYARALTQKGYICFGFDYRGFAKSEAAPGQVLLEDQVRDIANAVRFVRNRYRVQDKKLVLAGWGMGAGLILEAARVAEGIDALISVNGFYNAIRVQKAVRGEKDWQEFRAWFTEERTRLAAGGEIRRVDPFLIYPLDPESREYVDNVLRKNPDFGVDVHTNFGDSLLQFEPEGNLEHLVNTPILIAHGDRNQLHPVQEAHSLLEKYPGPKDSYWVPDAGHTEWMFDDHPNFLGLVKKIDQWMMSVV